MRLNLIMAGPLSLVCVPSITRAEPLKYENVLASIPADWQMVTGERQGQLTMSEFVPKGETVDDWSQMITIQVFHGLGHVDPKEFVSEMGREVKHQVRKGTAQIQTLDFPKDSEYPSFAVVWFMGEVKATGKGEITFIRAIQGKDALYVVQKAWRQAAFTLADQLAVPQEDLEGGVEFLRAAKVVDSRRSDTSGVHVDKQSYVDPAGGPIEK